MPSTSEPYGLIPVSHPSGCIRAVELRDGIASGYATAIYKYSPVKLATGGVLQIASTNEDIYGVFAGCFYETSTGIVVANQWTASATYTAGTLKAFVWADPQITYRIQSDATVAQTAIGDQADFVNPGSGSTTTGLSSAQIDATLVGASSQGQLRILDKVDSETNDWDDTYVDLLVQIARHQYVGNKVAI